MNKCLPARALSEPGRAKAAQALEKQSRNKMAGDSETSPSPEPLILEDMSIFYYRQLASSLQRHLLNKHGSFVQVFYNHHPRRETPLPFPKICPDVTNRGLNACPSSQLARFLGVTFGRASVIFSLIPSHRLLVVAFDGERLMSNGRRLVHKETIAYLDDTGYFQWARLLTVVVISAGCLGECNERIHCLLSYVWPVGGACRGS
ncbi:hypothetical protein BaRGS_00009406 [Batillaria attramentaria]|uniref:Uncharacterized protein n=1 Tax=Batillaria attramentaria TaxID=370345 RepID=A0ABD0LJG7_9CAEN